jgi:hypothetical protein
MKFGVIGLAVFAAVAAVGGASWGSGRSIFDDDWVPPSKSPAADAPRTTPARSGTPAVSTTTSPPFVAGHDAGSGAAAGTTGTTTTTTAMPRKVAVVVARRPVPAASEQAPVRKVLKEVFAEQLRDASVAGRRKLAASLLAYADKSRQVPTDQFVLLAAAVDAAVEGADLAAASAAARDMAAAFDVDPLDIRTEAAIRLGAGGRVVAAKAGADFARLAMGLADELARAEDFAAAARVCSAALSAIGTSDPLLRGQVLQRQRAVAALRDEADRVARDAAKLEASPDDRAANLSVGRYACFVKGEWEAGLAFLAKGSDAALAEVARRDARNPSAAQARYDLAATWHELSKDKALSPAYQQGMRARAAYWYEKAAPELTGLAKQVAAKRLAEIAAASPANVTPVKATGAVTAAGDAGVLVARENGPGVEVGLTELNATGSLTIQFEFRTTHKHNGCLLTKRGTEKDASVTIVVTDKGVIDVLADGDFYKKEIVGRTVVNDGRWHSVRAVKDGTTLRAFVDGAAEGEIQVRPELISASPWVVGRHGGWRGWTLDAQVRNLRIEPGK